MTPASIMMGVSRIETSWAPPPAIVGESGAEEKAKFFFPSIDNSQSEKKKKSARGSLEGKRGERNKNKSKRASRKKKRPSLSPSPCSLLKKKSRRSKQKKTPRSVSPSILFESLPEPFNKNALRPPVPRSLRGGSRVHGTAVGSDCGLRLCPCPQPLLSLLPLKKNIRVCIPLRSRWSTFSRPFPHGTSRALLFVLPFGRKRPEKEHARALWPADHSSETVYRSRIVL
jgi:hypothetical protein